MRVFLDTSHWRLHGTVSWQPVLIKNWQSARGDGLPRAILGAANHVRTRPASTSRLLGSSQELLNFLLYAVFSRDYHKGTLSKVSLSMSCWFILPIWKKSEEIHHPKKQHYHKLPQPPTRFRIILARLFIPCAEHISIPCSRDGYTAVLLHCLPERWKRKRLHENNGWTTFVSTKQTCSFSTQRNLQRFHLCERAVKTEHVRSI